MQPLARQDTRPSIYSWWSDSNPGLHGPTINLHAAAKPLSRFLYHRQALNIIKKNRDSPLSTATLEIYSSYFPWDFVSWSTKAAILSELADRARTSEIAARAVVDSPVLPHVEPMLLSPSTQTRSASCKLLRSMGLHSSTAPVILELQLCGRLVSLLRDEHPQVVREATSVLCGIAKSVGGAQAIADAKVMAGVPSLRFAPQQTCELVKELASHESTGPAVCEFETSVQLVSLLGEADFKIVESAMDALCEIVRWVDGACAVVSAGVRGHIAKLLQSLSPILRHKTCQLVGGLARHESTALVTSEPELCVRLVSLLSEEDPEVVRWATFALSQIARWLEDAKAAIDAEALDPVLALLESPNPHTRLAAYVMSGCLARRQSTAPAVFELRPFVRIVYEPNAGIHDLTHDGDLARYGAISALEGISKWSDGIAALADLDDILQRFEELSHDQSFGRAKEVQKIRNMLYNVARYNEHRGRVIDQ
ncbi:armadillo-type protein [Mycena albidolilacea]|uniref:Armadillo-type protein n=1 Tax=Mycena albidolilacea TaxID=1033008 RepID=A0AAD7AEJ5_9AGAR|nr:armadillo-type protein [Mycena albidolilacea]